MEATDVTRPSRLSRLAQSLRGTLALTLNVALPVGNYVAVVSFGDDKKVEKPFVITAGKRTRVEVSN